ncbi:dienelactone hydrolase family protein [Alkalihalobacillus sp. MEB130]|uniref:dienelactone hydrolase family protein n=1 Tax=Alkalihalobacillus sp. MEB130 TaxID=2976704 RepID=UPI0028DD73B7|nr:alpha/beta hydrolase family protein [Alkalihalobacillus sp. MEB130]MDT8859786.1 dienelactone hydrolase family protein [Alkalihalobacillus sp. MEB130]
MWSANPFLQKLYEETVQTHVVDRNRNKEHIKECLIEALGDFTSLEGELQPRIIEKVEYDSYERMRLEVQTCLSLRMPVYMLVPKMRSASPVPAVLAIHGHGYGSKEVVGLHPGGLPNLGVPGIHKNFAIELVKRGVVVVAPELIGFGERKVAATESATDNSCFELASQLLLYRKTLAGLRVYECRRILDYLNELPNINHKKIGCMGFSGGGLIAAFTSAIDERIKATVISGYANTFKDSIIARRHCLDNYLPGILQNAELPDLIGLIAPRSLCIEAGIHDHLFPFHGVQKAVHKLEKIYNSQDAIHAFTYDVFEGGHEVSGSKSFNWLVDSLAV